MASDIVLLQDNYWILLWLIGWIGLNERVLFSCLKFDLTLASEDFQHHWIAFCVDLEDARLEVKELDVWREVGQLMTSYQNLCGLWSRQGQGKLVISWLPFEDENNHIAWPGARTDLNLFLILSTRHNLTDF